MIHRQCHVRNSDLLPYTQDYHFGTKVLAYFQLKLPYMKRIKFYANRYHMAKYFSIAFLKGHAYVY